MIQNQDLSHSYCRLQHKEVGIRAFTGRQDRRQQQEDHPPKQPSIIGPYWTRPQWDAHMERELAFVLWICKTFGKSSLLPRNTTYAYLWAGPTGRRECLSPTWDFHHQACPTNSVNFIHANKGASRFFWSIVCEHSTWFVHLIPHSNPKCLTITLLVRT